jgi:hypothetical protein
MTHKRQFVSVGLFLDVLYNIAIFVIRGDKTRCAFSVKAERDSQERGDVGVFRDRPKPAFTRETLIEDNKSKERAQA